MGESWKKALWEESGRRLEGEENNVHLYILYLHKSWVLAAD